MGKGTNAEIITIARETRKIEAGIPKDEGVNRKTGKIEKGKRRAIETEKRKGRAIKIKEVKIRTIKKSPSK